MDKRDLVAVGIVCNVYKWLFYVVVGNSVCRMWEGCSCFPYSVNRVIHDYIATYAHFHNAFLLSFVLYDKALSNENISFIPCW